MSRPARIPLLQRLPVAGLLLTTSLFILAGCNNAETSAAPDSSAGNESTAPALNLCTEPRPEICTQEYNPVCATLADGSSRTYATGCTACSNADVTGWQPGEC